MARTTVQLTAPVRRMVHAYRRELLAAKIASPRLIVFGSQAKGTPQWDSDVDVAVVSPSFGKNYHRELVRLLELRRGRWTLIEPHPMHPDDLNDRWSTFAHEVKTYGIPVD